MNPAQADPVGRSLFGEVARDLGLLTPEQVDRALQIQAQLRSQNAPHRRIGEILAEQHVLDLRTVQKVLLEQRRRREGGGAPGQPPHGRGHIGSFEILEVLGAGGMGSVYKAKDLASGRVVALKVLAPRLAEDEEFVTRFEREVKAASTLTHPNIIHALGAGTADGERYMVMEYVEGQNLGKILNEAGRLSEHRALLIARDMARALDHAHVAGIVHRDVKPDNVLVTGSGQAKLTDFGLAKLLGENLRLTQTGTALGTPHYISPEQVAGGRYLDHRADQYSLGAMLFHMLTGQVPFDGPTNNDIMLRHLEEPVRDPRELVPQISPGAVQIVFKLMAKKSAERYDSTGQVAEDLERVLNWRPPQYAASVRDAPAQPQKRPGCGTALIMFIIAVAWIITCCN